jgi:hypothetical protein
MAVAERDRAAEEPFRPDALVRVSRWLVGGCAVAMLVLGAAKVAFIAAAIPPVLAYTNMGGAVLNLLVAWQLGRGHRAAWAFGVAIAIVLTVINLLGLSNMLRAGEPGYWSIALETLLLFQAGLLIAAKSRF